MKYKDFFHGKKITVMGLGLLGRGVGDAKFLAECGAELVVTDLKTKEQLKTSLDKLKKFSNITYRLGEHSLEDFRNRDFILKAGGVPLDSIYIAEAKKQGIPIKMSESWFAELAPVVTVGVTGTRGKSTVTHLIHHILEAAGKRVLLGGNVRGVSTLSLLTKARAGDIAVMELDSWRLQGFGEAGISPQVAVFTNLLPDHLNYYGGDLEMYFADKANIFLNQKATDVVFVGKEVAKRIKAPGRKVAPEALPDNWKFALPGKHNRINAGLAVAVARELGIPESLIKKAIASFRGVPGRLELVRNNRGVKFYNDTNSTTPDALCVGLEALGSEKKNVVLIMGGADKNLDMSKALKAARKYCKEIILLPGTGTDKLPAKFIKETKLVKNLPEAVDAAKGSAKRGDVVLFSPGYASFGLFKNEYDRGDQFNRLMKKADR